VHLLSGWFTSLRGRLVAWYLSILAVLLSGLCVFQTVILTRYFHSTRAAGMGHSVASGFALVLQARLTLVFGALAVFLIAAAVALPIINRALAPLQHVVQTAEAIAAGDLAKRANLAPTLDEVGRLGEAFDIMVDRLHDAVAGSTASEERMRQFLADASHELRTPLTVLLGTSQVLLRKKDLDPEEFDAAMAAIHDESIRLSRLVDDLLTLSRLDAGQVLEPHPVAVSRFLAEFVRRYASAWPTRALIVETVELDGAQAHVDPEALRRMLTNVVDNAARYSAPGRPIVIAGTSAPNSVSIMVRDEGPGLSREDAERVFERFYRGNKSRSRLSGGTGLGLAIVRALVEQSRGEILIDTGPDKGTTVAIRLPRLTRSVQLAPV